MTEPSNDNSLKGKKPTPVKLAKLSSGESILCHLVGMDDTSLICKEPLKIISMAHPNGEYVNYGLAPFIELGVSKTVIISSHHIVTIMNATDDATIMYNKFLSAQIKADVKKTENRARPAKGSKPVLVYENKDHPYFSDDRDAVYPMLVEDDDPEVH